MKKLTYLLLIIISVAYFSYGQNLVPNSSFEDTVSCSSTGSINDVTFWNSPTSATPDYFNECSIGNFDVPSNALGTQNARTGKAYAGIVSIINSGTWRECLQINLSSSLIAGVTYCVEFYVMIADSSTYSVNNIGAYFSNSPISSVGVGNLLVSPQIQNSPITNPIEQFNTWQLVSDSFISIGGEEYMIIGNFTDNSNTDTTMFNTTSWAEGYQYIDDIKVQPCSTISINEIASNNKISIFLNPSNQILNIFSNELIKSYSIYSSLGTLIKQEQPLHKSVTIDISAFPTGIYFLYIRVENQVAQKKLFLSNQ